MKTTVIIQKWGKGYKATANDMNGVAFDVPYAGLTPADAAATAAAQMIRHAINNPEGGEVMAPDEVLERVPEHLRKIEGKPQRERF